MELEETRMRWIAALLLMGAMGISVAQQPGELPESNPSQPAARTQASADQDAPRPGTLIVPAGTQIPLRLAQAISTKNAKVGDAVYAETAFPVVISDKVIIPAGTYVQGRISQIRRPGRVKGKAEFLMLFTALVYKNGYTVALPGSVENLPGSDTAHVRGKEGTVEDNGSKGKDAGTIATTAGTGAAIGGVADRSIKGAGIGGGVGAAAGLIATLLTRGPDINLPEGTSVQMVLDRPLTLQEARIRQ